MNNITFTLKTRDDLGSNLINKQIKIFGSVVEGSHKASSFTCLPWVQDQFRTKLGFEPFAGTLNLEIGQKDLDILDSLKKELMHELSSPDDNNCSARVYLVYLENIKGAVIIPDENVDIHGKYIIEILAPVHLRSALNLKDGDRVELKLKKDISTGKLNVEAVLFDLDGTLIDSIESYYRLVEIALKELDFPSVSRKRILQASQRDPFDWSEVLPDIPGETLKATSKKIIIVLEKIYPEEFLKNVHPFPCTRSILETLHAAKIKIAIATATNKKFLNDKMEILDKTGASHLIEFVICAEDVKRKKPYPDSLILCHERLGILPEKCVYIGDMGTDIDAGKAAGMKTIAVLTGFESKKELEAKQPDAILTSIADLPDVLDIQRPAKNC